MKALLTLLIFIIPLFSMAMPLGKALCLSSDNKAIFEFSHEKGVDESTYIVKLEVINEFKKEWELDSTEVLNLEDSFFRIYQKSFGFLNWESLDLKFYPEDQYFSLRMIRKNTSWLGDTELSTQDYFFTDCEI